MRFLRHTRRELEIKRYRPKLKYNAGKFISLFPFAKRINLCAVLMFFMESFSVEANFKEQRLKND